MVLVTEANRLRRLEQFLAAPSLKHRRFVVRRRRRGAGHQVSRVIGFRIAINEAAGLRPFDIKTDQPNGRFTLVQKLPIDAPDQQFGIVHQSFSRLPQASVDLRPDDQGAGLSETLADFSPNLRHVLLCGTRHRLQGSALDVVEIEIAVKRAVHAVLPAPHFNASALRNGRGWQPHPKLSHAQLLVQLKVSAVSELQRHLQDVGTHAMAVVQQADLRYARALLRIQKDFLFAHQQFDHRCFRLQGVIHQLRNGICGVLVPVVAHSLYGQVNRHNVCNQFARHTSSQLENALSTLSKPGRSGSTTVTISASALPPAFTPRMALPII